MTNMLHTSPQDDTILDVTENIDTLLTNARPRLLRLTHAQGISADAAEDIVQETLLEAWRHLNALRDPNRFDAWLNGICRNVCLRWQRSQHIATTHLVSLSELAPAKDDDASESAIPDPTSFDPAEELSRQDMALLLDRALGYLPDSTCKAVELHYLSELPQREAALQLGMTIHVLEERLYRARHQLRQLLNNELRSEAELFGLALDAEDTDGWRTSREWCFFCGQHRLLGKLESREGYGNLLMRCPSCSRMYGDCNINQHRRYLYGLHSFKPALKRVREKMLSWMPQAIADGSYPCHACGKLVKLRLIPPNEPYADYYFLHPEHVLALICPSCGECSSMWAGNAAVWFSPISRAFQEQHPRSIIGPEIMTEYANQPALRFCLIDVTSNAQLIIFAHARTLQVLATFQE
ncbi:MAG TPA: RNA polymerase sigma factor [Ktedonobacteraceae bacterium]|nr:RNA polymerase sigma factor [Ktedonobacteraceae bacterium]